MKPHPLVKEVAGAQEGDLSPNYRLEQGLRKVTCHLITDWNRGTACLLFLSSLNTYYIQMNTSAVRNLSDANVFFTFYSLRKTSK